MKPPPGGGFLLAFPPREAHVASGELFFNFAVHCDAFTFDPAASSPAIGLARRPAARSKENTSSFLP
jgi:hypothetical protein